MANNENMINETIEVMNDNVMVDEGSVKGTGVAMLIGAGLAVAVCAAVGLGKKAIAAWKAKKEFNQPDKEIVVDAEDLADVAVK